MNAYGEAKSSRVISQAGQEHSSAGSRRCCSRGLADIWQSLILHHSPYFYMLIGIRVSALTCQIQHFSPRWTTCFLGAADQVSLSVQKSVLDRTACVTGVVVALEGHLVETPQQPAWMGRRAQQTEGNGPQPARPDEAAVAIVWMQLQAPLPRKANTKPRLADSSSTANPTTT